MTRPNFFFAGHPRSGTGTLDGYLLRHPKIFMGAKELHYFGSDLKFNVPERSLENYLSYFTKAKADQKIGESSTWYLASETAAKEIKEFAPDAKIIISLRNPVDWLYSLHSHQYYAAYEDEGDFSNALIAEPSRLKGQNLPNNAFPKCGVMYRSLVDYSSQVTRYIETFGKDQVLVHLFDDLKSNPERTLDMTLEFLQVEKDFPEKEDVLRGSKKRRNANHKSRSRRLHRWIKSPPRRSVLHGVIPQKFRGQRFALRALQRLNTMTAPREPMQQALREKLIQEFRPEVEKLEVLLNREISEWKS